MKKYTYLSKIAKLTTEIDRAGLHNMASKLDKILKQAIHEDNDNENEWLDDRERDNSMIANMQQAKHEADDELYENQEMISDMISSEFSEPLQWRKDVDDKLYSSIGPFNVFIEIESEFRGPSKFIVTIENGETNAHKVWTVDASDKRWKIQEEAMKVAHEIGNFIAE